jgi:D-glycero-D-manno-heptose 1,7-bisphosphate phosphatase
MAVTGLQSAVFLDKDGTLIENVPYNVDLSLIRFTPGALDGARLLAAAGFRLVVVSNQSGISRGLFSETALSAVHDRLVSLLSAAGVTLSGFYYCPHVPADDCECRKPKPGLLLRAARELSLDLSASWLIGDILDDVEAGRRAGCRTILLANGGETEWLPGAFREPHYVALNIAEAAALVAAALETA